MRTKKHKPTQLKLVTGNPGHYPLNENEPKPKLEIPAPPSELTEDARIEWEYVAGRLFAIGCLADIDRGALAAYCQAYGRWQQAERALAEMAKKDPLTGGLLIKTSNGNAIQNPLVGTANKAMAAMVRYAAEFGMTPSARARIQAQPPDQTDTAARYFTG